MPFSRPPILANGGRDIFSRVYLIAMVDRTTTFAAQSADERRFRPWLKNPTTSLIPSECKITEPGGSRVAYSLHQMDDVVRYKHHSYDRSALGRFPCDRAFAQYSGPKGGFDEERS